mmetsp:Transcript_6821/g.13935  ORF Transcript_6821/g.13935 Transcript_6821/m.13935 type:complete len:207 (+) Transcript_6821:240-860(+)
MLMNQTPPTPATSQVFGVVVPGGAVRTDFQPTDQTGTKFALALSGISGSSITAVSDLVFFLLPGVQLPEGHGAVLYWQIVGSTNTEFNLVGAIANHQPSGVFRTGWSTNESLGTAVSSQSVTINLGVSIEPMSNIQNMGAMQNQTIHVAKKIAMDLFNYMRSFDTGTAGAGNMVVPNNVFDRWMKRFEGKARVDPNFFMKKSDDEI